MAQAFKRIDTVGEGIIICELLYDDVSLIAQRLQVINNSDMAYFIQISRDGGLQARSRTVLAGGTLDFAIPTGASARIQMRRWLTTDNLDGIEIISRYPA